MNQLFRLCLLATVGVGWALTACQPQQKPVTTAASAHPAVVIEAPALVEAVSDTQIVDERSQSSGPFITKAGPPVKNVATFLANNDLSMIWQASSEKAESSSSRPTLLEGFYGDEHRHIAFIFDRVRQDSVQPNLFRVHGRSRFRKVITPFEGTFTVTHITPLSAFLDLDSVAATQARVYTATVHFALREDTATLNTGIYEGNAILDFFRLATGELQPLEAISIPDKDLPARGAGQLFRGHWQSYRTSRRQVVAFAVYSQAVVPNAMADLFLGDRGEAINPKYAHLGWSEAWENTEWWARSPKPRL